MVKFLVSSRTKEVTINSCFLVPFLGLKACSFLLVVVGWIWLVEVGSMNSHLGYVRAALRIKCLINVVFMLSELIMVRKVKGKSKEVRN